MKTDRSRLIREGIQYGVAAGVLFAVVEAIAAAAMGQPALRPFRLFASVIVFRDALTWSGGLALVVGALVHLVLSALFGAIYGGVLAGLGRGARESAGAGAALGVIFGFALWLVNFQVIARVLYPWFLDAPQAMHAVLHAVFYGLPLGVLVGAAERRPIPASRRGEVM